MTSSSNRAARRRASVDPLTALFGGLALGLIVLFGLLLGSTRAEERGERIPYSTLTRLAGEVADGLRGRFRRRVEHDERALQLGVDVLAEQIVDNHDDHAGIGIRSAVRERHLLLDEVRRAETQQVDRILEEFSRRYWECNPGSLFGNQSAFPARVYACCG